MHHISPRKLAPALGTAALLLAAATTWATPQPSATLTLQYQQSEHKAIDGDSLFGHYLGTGDGVASGVLDGNVTWDVYEDQSRDDLHPAQFRGFVERAGKRHPFQILGVYTPEGSEKVATPTGHEPQRRWTFSGTIVFEDDSLLGVRHAPVTGTVDTSAGQATYTIWLDPASPR